MREHVESEAFSTSNRGVACVVATISLALLITLVPVVFAIEWNKYSGNPIVRPTPGGWDADFTTTPEVLFDGAKFRMWFAGGSSGVVTGIGYATSPDGFTWTQYPSPVLVPDAGAWDSGQIGLGSVLWNGTRYLMWYSGSSPIAYPNGAVGLATSSDGITWVKYPGNPVLRPTAVDQKFISSPFVVAMNISYNMWYTAKSASDSDSAQITRILLATSFDGKTWSKWPSPVLGPSTNPLAWDSSAVYAPSVIFTGSFFGMWYAGLSGSHVNPRIGFATSPDGATWNTSAVSNPILSPGSPGSWDASGVEQPCVVVGFGFMIYYDGIAESQATNIGVALSPQGFTIPEFPASILTIAISVLVAACLLRWREGRLPERSI